MRSNFNSTVSQDVKAVLEYYSFNNLSAFYFRFRNTLTISRATFYRAMSGSPASLPVVLEIESLARKLGLLNTGGVEGATLTARIEATKKLCMLVKKYGSSKTPQNWDAVERHLLLNKSLLES